MARDTKSPVHIRGHHADMDMSPGIQGLEMRSAGATVSMDVAAVLLRVRVPENQHAPLLAALAAASARDASQRTPKRSDVSFELEHVSSPFHERGGRDHNRAATSEEGGYGSCDDGSVTDLAGVLLGFGVPLAAHDEVLAALNDLSVVGDDVYTNTKRASTLAVLWATPYRDLGRSERAKVHWLVGAFAVIVVAATLGLSLILALQRPSVASLRAAAMPRGAFPEPNANTPSPTPGHGVPSPTPGHGPFDAFQVHATAHPLAPQTKRWGVVTAPYPTGAWWTNAMLDDGTSPIAVLPYVVSVAPLGLAVSYPADRRDTSVASRVADAFSPDVTFGSNPKVDASVPASVAAFDALSVTLTYKTVASSGKKGSLTVPLVKGAPFVTVAYEDAWPSLSFGVGSSLVRATALSLAEEAAGGTDPKPDPSCAANAGCAGLSGDCCPTSGGTSLGCCGGSVTTTPASTLHPGVLFLELSNGQRWILAHSLSQPGGGSVLEAAWDATSLTLGPSGKSAGGTTTPPASQVLRLARVVGQATPALSQAFEAELLRFRDAYPTGGQVGYSSGTGGSAYVDLTFDWTVGSLGFAGLTGAVASVSPVLAMMALPHHLDGLASSQGLSGLGAAGQVAAASKARFTCLKGVGLGLVQGSRWAMRYPREAPEWDAPLAVNEALGEATAAGATTSTVLAAQASWDLHHSPGLAPSTYTFGKQASRIARLALISSQVGDAATAKAATRMLSDALGPWLGGTNADALAFDATWGGIVSKDALGDFMADFGMGWYNDHHYHFGYFLYAASVLVKLDPTFLSADPGRRPALLALAHDVANPPRGYGGHSPHFPGGGRHKDWFDGHSWASGLFSQANGKSQESVSEASGCYYAVALLAEALAKDPTNHAVLLGGERDDPSGLGDLAAAALALEHAAARRYWQVPSSASGLGGGVAVYPPPFVAANRMVGVVAGLDAVARTWFGTELEFVHCIQMIPFTPSTAHLLGAPFVADELPPLLVRAPSAPEAWRGFIYQAQALLSPSAAWASIVDLHGTAAGESMTAATVDEGDSVTSMLYWAATRGVV